LLFSRIKAAKAKADHSPYLVPWLKMSGGVIQVPTYAFIAGTRTNISFKTHMLLNTGGSFSV